MQVNPKKRRDQLIKGDVLTPALGSSFGIGRWRNARHGDRFKVTGIFQKGPNWTEITIVEVDFEGRHVPKAQTFKLSSHHDLIFEILQAGQPASV